MKLTSLCKLSFIMGSRHAFFSASNILFPVSGLFLGVSGSCLWFAMSLIIRLLYGGSFYLHLVYGVPGFCASLYMASPHKLIRLVLPLVCIILFIAHPIGFYAAPYALYWLIPLILYKKRSLFANALGATFTAHAVGSVFWLYLNPLPVAYWWGLIPIVALERVCFASGAVVLYAGCMKTVRMVFTIKKSAKAFIAAGLDMHGFNR